jgi:hypothetical protein
MAKAKLKVEGSEISLFQQDKKDYISLTDIAKQVGKRTDIILSNWLRSPNTLNYLNEWECLYNENFDTAAYQAIRKRVGDVGFYLTSKGWIESTNAIGIIAKQGRGGGTYAQKDIAFEFCSAVSAKFKLYLIQEFERLKTDEATALGLKWNVRRELAKINYQLHTDAVRENRVPLMDWNTKREAITMASEADLLNMALYGISAKEWRIANPDKKGNIRDHSSMEQLVVLSNLQNLNAYFLSANLPKDKRFQLLFEEAKSQLSKLTHLKGIDGVKNLK